MEPESARSMSRVIEPAGQGCRPKPAPWGGPPHWRTEVAQQAPTTDIHNISCIPTPHLYSGGIPFERTTLRWQRFEMCPVWRSAYGQFRIVQVNPRLQRHDLVDKKQLTVGKSKTEAGTGRVTPLNDTVLAALQMHATWYIRRFGECKPEWYVFPAGKGQPNDPTQPVTTLTLRTAWTKVRDKAKVVGRWHDNRHTLVTELAECAGDEVIMSIAGHVSRAMLSRYSHVRWRRSGAPSTRSPHASVRPTKSARWKRSRRWNPRTLLRDRPH